MNLVVHQFKKDVRHLRWMLLIWVLLIALQAWFTLCILSGRAWPPDPDDFTTCSGLVGMLRWAFLVAMVPLLILEEPLVGTNAFGLTRPLSWRTLLVCKTLYCLLILIALPVLVEATVLGAHHIHPRYVAMVAFEVALTNLEVILIAAVIAVFVQNFTRFVIVGIAMVVGYFFMILTLPLLFGRGFGTLVGLTPLAAAVNTTLLLVFTVAAIWHQYATRSTRRSIRIAVFGLLVQIGNTYFLSWDFIGDFTKPQPLSPPTPKETFDKKSVVAVLDATTIQRSLLFSDEGRDGPRDLIYGQFQFSGVGKDYNFEVAPYARFSLQRSPDTQSILMLTADPVIFKGRHQRSCIQNLLGDVRIMGRELPEFLKSYPLFVVNGNFPGGGSDGLKGDLEGDITFNVFRNRIVEEIPLKNGSGVDRPFGRVVIDQVLPQPVGASVFLRELKLNFRFAGDPNTAPTQTFLPQTYVLANKERNEAFLGNETSRSNVGGNLGSHVSSQIVGITFLMDKDHPAIDSQWLARATLLRIETVWCGNVTFPVHVPDFVLPPKP